MLYLRVPQITPVLCQKDEGGLFCHHCHVLLRQWRENLPYVLYTEAAEETATVLILESIVRHYVSVSKSRVAIFKQYNVNNVKLNSSTQLREKCTMVSKS